MTLGEGEKLHFQLYISYIAEKKQAVAGGDAGQTGDNYRDFVNAINLFEEAGICVDRPSYTLSILKNHF